MKLDGDEETPGLESDIAGKKESFESIKAEIDRLNDEKKELNRLFYKKFSRFIQEGTWISEEYYDDEKYFYDA
jgi:phage-related minor tail protein